MIRAACRPRGAAGQARRRYALRVTRGGAARGAPEAMRAALRRFARPVTDAAAQMSHRLAGGFAEPRYPEPRDPEPKEALS